MAKEIHICSNCNKEFGRWLGKCPNCNEYGTIEKTIAQESLKNVKNAGLKTSGSIAPIKKALTIKELSNKPIKRTSTKINELDRVLGGGLVDSEVVLLAGAPGAGKSTLSLRLASNLAETGMKVLYVSGEESEQQIGLRAERMKVENDLIKIVHETNLETVLGHIEEEAPNFMIVDSLQTLASVEIAGSMGSISQSKEAANTLTRIAKSQGITMLLINQIIKSGEFAGAESSQHIVDCALMLESDKDSPLKFLRASKNRFGDSSEIGIFQHSEEGLEEVSDPSGILIDNEESYSGAACSFISEGIRQIPVEVQALVSRSTLPTPRKQFSGVNFNRGQIVCAILDKFNNTRLFEKDVFISTVSGTKINDPQSDLSVAAALLSSTQDKNILEKTMFVGELSLTGVIRGSFMIENKIKEAERLGFENIVIPRVAFKNLKKTKTNIKIHSINKISELNKFIKN